LIIQGLDYILVCY